MTDVKRLNGVFDFVILDMLRVFMVLSGVPEGLLSEGWRVAWYTDGGLGLGECIREDCEVG